MTKDTCHAMDQSAIRTTTIAAAAAESRYDAGLAAICVPLVVCTTGIVELTKVGPQLTSMTCAVFTYVTLTGCVLFVAARA